MRISDWSSDVCSSDLRHLASLRLLPSTRPHLLGTLFERLCTHGVPVGPNIFEITRLCLPPSLSRPERMLLRGGLIRAMVDHALDRGIHRFTGVVPARFREQVLGMGWHGEALGRGQELRTAGRGGGTEGGGECMWR